MNRHQAHVLKDTTHFNYRVYFEDTDAAGVMYHANYLKFMERARSEWFLQHSFGMDGLMRQFGCVFVVSRTELDYLHSAKLENLLNVTVRLTELKKASAVFQQQVLCTHNLDVASTQPVLTCQGNVTVVCVNAATFRPTAIPQDVIHALKTLQMP